MKAEEVACGFCRGSGRDRFAMSLQDSKCRVCGGRGRVWVAVPHRGCAHCQGSGAVKNLTCTVCGGKGAVPSWLLADAICPQCRGSGDDQSAGALSCLNCRGSGRIVAGSNCRTSTAIHAAGTNH